MVNTGKPSKGCFLCRKRRVKCDERKPGCMNCQRLKRQCPGYRTAFDSILRNESDTAHLRAHGPHTAPMGTSISANGAFLVDFEPVSMANFGHSRHHSDPTGLRSRSKVRENAVTERKKSYAFQRKESSIYQPLNGPIEQRALCYFLANYILLPRGGRKCGFMTFVLPLMKMDDPSSVLSFSLKAVSLAVFANQPNSKAVLPQAEAFYTKALRQVTQAIGDPELALQDITLASVLLLAIFETVTCANKDQASTSHITGATTLIKMRGEKMPQNEVSRNLVLTARAQMGYHCLMNGVKPLVDDTDIGVRGPLGQVEHLHTQTARIRYDCDQIMASANRGINTIEKVVSLMREGETVDQAFLEWFQRLPADWQYRTVGWNDVADEDLETSYFSPGKVDKYQEKWSVHTYNMARASRLLLASTSIRCAAWLSAPGDYKATPEYAKAARLCRELVDDIVASVPSGLGGFKDDDESTNRPSPYGFPCGTDDETTGKGLSGLSLLWPMYAVLSSDFATDAQRKWMRGRFKYVGEYMGIMKAKSYADDPPELYPSSQIAEDDLHLSAPRNEVATASLSRESLVLVGKSPENWTDEVDSYLYSQYSHTSPGSSAGISDGQYPSDRATAWTYVDWSTGYEIPASDWSYSISNQSEGTSPPDSTTYALSSETSVTNDVKYQDPSLPAPYQLQDQYRSVCQDFGIEPRIAC